MKTCPKCKIQVGGGAEFCPLCQSPLTGTPTDDAWPSIVPKARRYAMWFKVLAFLLLAACVVCVTIDFALPCGFHWSGIVVVCTATFLILLRLAMHRYQSAPRLLFQLLLGVSAAAVICDLFVGYSGFSLYYVVPLLCMATLASNFILAFVQKGFAENGLVYILMNILVGVVPYVLLLFCTLKRPFLWIVCLAFSVITFLGLVVFRGPRVWAELQKRLHM